MDDNSLRKTIAMAKQAALDAGKAIMEIYESGDFSIDKKADNSPLTLADRKGHDIICHALAITGFPILSEEGKAIPYEERKDWDYFWMVDPLDGTKEFIKKNGEFTVNIALIRNQKPVAGVVYAPALDLLFWAVGGQAWKQKGKEPAETIRVNSTGDIRKIVASKSHLSPETQAFIDQYPGAELVSMGSSLKFLLVADGTADIYPRYAPTMEWDTAAAQAVVEGAGGRVLQFEKADSLEYNKENLLNPWFLVTANPS